jgi:hypothetical protein
MQMNTAIDFGLWKMTDKRDIRQRRSRAVRTAWILAAIAGLIFVAFILSGVLAD